MAGQASVEARNNGLNAWFTTTMANGGFLRVWDNSGGKPINTSAARLGVNLIKFTCGSPFALFPASAILLPTIPAQVNALASGTALYYDLVKNDNATVVWQDDIVASGNGLVLNPSNDVIVAGMPQNVNSWSITVGGS